MKSKSSEHLSMRYDPSDCACGKAPYKTETVIIAEQIGQETDDYVAWFQGALGRTTTTKYGLVARRKFHLCKECWEESLKVNPWHAVGLIASGIVVGFSFALVVQLSNGQEIASSESLQIMGLFGFVFGGAGWAIAYRDKKDPVKIQAYASWRNVAKEFGKREGRELLVFSPERWDSLSIK